MVPEQDPFWGDGGGFKELKLAAFTMFCHQLLFGSFFPCTEQKTNHKIISNEWS